MVKGTYQMKKFKIAALSALCASIIAGTSFASETILAGDTNPFLEDHAETKSSHIEPTGVEVYSFSEESNAVTEIDKDRSYLDEARETKEYGHVNVHSSKVRNFKKLVRDYQAHAKEFKSTLLRSATVSKNKDKITPASNVYTFKKAAINTLIDSKKDILLESASGNFIKNKGWDSSTRILKAKKLGTVIISEWDFSVSGGGVIMDEDAVNFYVNGNPGILIIRQTESGAAETVLSWADKHKSYTIELDNNVNKRGAMAQLKSFAESISGTSYPMERMR